MVESDPSVALILSGGGAAGAYEIGVMKALFSGRSPATAFQLLQPQIFAGTSVGAINASLLLSSPAADYAAAVGHLEHIYLNDIAASGFGSDSGVLRVRANPLPLLDPANYEDADPWRQFTRDLRSLSWDVVLKILRTLASSATLEERLINLADLSLLVDSSSLRRLISRYLNTSRIALPGKTLRIMATNWADGTLRVFRGEDLTSQNAVDVIVASSAIPGIFPPVSIDGAPYVDGGVVMNAALRPCIDAGATEIHLVYVDSAVKDLQVSPDVGTASIFVRTLTIALAAFLNRDLEMAARINLGLAVNSGRQDPDSNPAERASLFEAGSVARKGKADYRPLTIHRYRPDESTGDFNWLDFSKDRIRRNIHLGYEDTIRHDCARQQCVLP